MMPPREEVNLSVAGVVPFSSVDWPGILCAVIFCRGCPWRCRYCHNSHLRPFETALGVESWTWEKSKQLLRSRTGFLEGVVFSGGEATAQPCLTEAIRETRAMGYRIGLHTSGAYPDRLAVLLPLIDWVGLDIKAPLDQRYDLITGVPGSAYQTRSSLDAVLRSGVDYQLRTTVHSKLQSPSDLEDLYAQLAQIGSRPTVIQSFRAQGCRDQELIDAAA